MASKTKLKFEREITRLHVEKFFEGLGPAPKGVHLVLISEFVSISHWYRAAEDYVRDVKNSLGDPLKTESKGTVEDLIVEDAEFGFPADDGPSSFAVDVQLLGVCGLDDRYEVDTCTVLICGEGNENLEHPSLMLVDSRTVVELDLDLIVHAADTCGRALNKVEAYRLSRMPHRRRNVAFHSPRPIGESHALQTQAARLERAKQEAERLEREQAEAEKAKSRPKKDVRVVPEDTPYLHEMHGYGPAADWGMELAADMEDWRRGHIRWNDVDNGVLLSGPPGCGKTTFAKALARTLDAHLVVGSYSVWLGNGEGHQGTLISGMRAAFAEARKHAPSVILVDEIDNFVQRGSIGHARNDEWNRGVVNGLLECLDGAVEREGVIVVGATNDVSGIDAALRRAGRLDRHIEIPLPDAKARAAILRQHLDADMDVTCLDRETEGMSGADLERVARDARRRARRERADVELHHVRASLPVRRAHTPEQLRHIAVHECGHAVVAAALGCKVREVFVEPDFIPDSGAYIGGAALIEHPSGTRHAIGWYMDRIASMLGGMAAEQMVYGDHSDGVAVDLAGATELALHAAAGYGMRGSLYSRGIPGMSQLSGAPDFDPGLRHGIDDLLHDQAARARAILEEHREAFAELVELLLKHRRIDGAVVHEVVARPRRQLALAI